MPDSTSTSPTPRRHRWLRWLLIMGLIALGTSIALQAQIGDYGASPQFADGQFRNITPEPANAPKPGAKVMWDFFFNKPGNTVPDGTVPVHKLTRAELDAAPDRSLYRLGHSTLLMKLRGHWWITDPVFSERASPVQFMGPKRFHAPPISLEDLPPLRGVLISHDHYDHLDTAAIKALATKTDMFLTPLGVGDRLIDWGVPREKVQQFDWWQDFSSDGLKLTFTPTQHFSGRGLRDGNRTLWGSWVIIDGERRVFFSGDSGYFDGFKEIGHRFGPFDLTLVETGAYNTQWPYVHMMPVQSVQAHRDLQGRWMLPIHNGTFDLAMHPWYDPFEQVLKEATAQSVSITTPIMGERIDIDAPHAGSTWWRSVGSAAETARH